MTDPRWSRLDTVGLLILILMILVLAFRSHAAGEAPCPPDLVRSPHSGLCAVEGTDAWFGVPGTFGDPSYPRRLP